MNKGPNFKQSSPLGFEISCSAISIGTQECLSAQSEPIGIMLYSENKPAYPDRLQVTEDFVIKSELLIPISHGQKSRKIRKDFM